MSILDAMLGFDDFDGLQQFNLRGGNKSESKVVNDFGDLLLNFSTRKEICDPELAEKFIDAGVAYNKQNSFGFTPLHFAAGSGCKKVLDLLIQQKNINIDSVCTKGLTPFLFSLEMGTHEFMTLLANGANVHHKDNFGESAMHYVTRKSNPDNWMFEQLLIRGADPSDANNAGQTPIHFAAYYGHNQILTTILGYKGVNINYTDDNGQTPLLLSLINKKSITANELIKHGADPSIKDANGNTALLYASRYDSNISKIILDHEQKSDINAHDEDGMTALIHTIQRNDVWLAHDLMDAGANITHKSNSGSTAYMEALQNCNNSIIKELFNHGLSLRDTGFINVIIDETKANFTIFAPENCNNLIFNTISKIIQKSSEDYSINIQGAYFDSEGHVVETLDLYSNNDCNLNGVVSASEDVYLAA
jgi:ankyrin repeat protein